MYIWKRALTDTIGHIKTLLGAAFTGVASLVALYYWKGHDMTIAEIPYVVVGLIGALSGVAFLFIWNLLAAPCKIQRERADNAESRLAELESETALPNAVLRSLESTQTETEYLKQSMITLSKLFEQYRRLLNGALLSDELKGVSMKDSDLSIVASFISEEAQKLLPKLAFSPSQALVFQTGWNEYRYIFVALKRIVPNITFPDLPREISATVISASKIDFIVQFYHRPSNNISRVEPQSFVADAEL